MKTLIALALCTLPLSAHADEISDTLKSVIEAYEAGDLKYALEEMAYARQQIEALRTQDLAESLPEAPAGWTMGEPENMSPNLAMMGGGIGAQADYTNGTDTVSLTIMADNPMVMAFGGMIGNAAMMGAKIVRVGREKFMLQDDQMTGLLDGRVMVQAEGADPEVMTDLLQAMDFAPLQDFGR